MSAKKQPGLIGSVVTFVFVLAVIIIIVWAIGSRRG
jgi:hypothetical protein